MTVLRRFAEQMRMDIQEQALHQIRSKSWS